MCLCRGHLPLVLMRQVILMLLLPLFLFIPLDMFPISTHYPILILLSSAPLSVPSLPILPISLQGGFTADRSATVTANNLSTRCLCRHLYPTRSITITDCQTILVRRQIFPQLRQHLRTGISPGPTGCIEALQWTPTKAALPRKGAVPSPLQAIRRLLPPHLISVPAPALVKVVSGSGRLA